MIGISEGTWRIAADILSENLKWLTIYFCKLEDVTKDLKLAIWISFQFSVFRLIYAIAKFEFRPTFW